MWSRSQIFFNLALLRYFLYGKMYQREIFFLSGNINRGYYMAARRYAISLRVLKNISRVRCAHSWKIFSTRGEKFRISKRPCNVLFIKHQWNTKPFHFNSFFGVKGAIYYVTIATVIFSHVKITCYFHMWRYQVCARKLTWYFIGVYLIQYLCL